MNTQGWRVEKSAEDDQNTEAGFIQAIASQWDSDESLEEMAVFADWLDDRGDSAAARYIRPSGSVGAFGFPDATYLVSVYEETIHPSEPDVYPEITDEELSSDQMTLDEILAAIGRGGYYQEEGYDGLVFTSGPSQNYRTGAETTSRLFIQTDAGGVVPGVVADLILAILE